MIRQQLITTENYMQISYFTLSDLVLYLDERKFKQIITAKIIKEVMRKINEENNYNYCFSDMENNLDIYSEAKEKPKKIGKTYSKEIKLLCVKMRQEEKGIKKISKETGIGQGAVRRYIKQFKRGELK